MSSGFSINGIINRTGSIPGAIRGDIADRPAAGNAPGDWYLAEDEQILYGWIGGAWVVLLDGSGPGTLQDLDSVTSTAPGFGTTDNDIKVVNTLATAWVLTQQSATNAFCEARITATGTFVRVRAVPGTGIAYIEYGDSSGNIGQLRLATSLLNANRNWQLPYNANGVIQVSGNGLRLPTRSVSADTTLLLTDYTLLVNTSGGDVTITLPNTIVTGNDFTDRVYNAKVAVTGNDIILAPAGGALIDGAATYTITGGAAMLSAQFQFDGTNWYIL